MRSERARDTGSSILLTGRVKVSDCKETQRLHTVDGHKDSGNLLPTIFLDANSISAVVSPTGVDGDRLVGDDGLEGNFLSADIALFGASTVEFDDTLTVGEGQHFGLAAVDGVEDLYLELTSMVRDRRVVSFLLSAGTNGGLVVSSVDRFCNACSDSHASIQTAHI